MSDGTEEVPARRRWRVADVVCAAGLAAGLVLSYVFSLLTPTLLKHHVVLLETLTASVVSTVTGGSLAHAGRTSLPLVLLAPLAGIVIYDLFLWWAGRLWGQRVAEVYTRRRPRAARGIARAEALVRRRGVWALAVAYYLPFPNAVVYVTCGVSEMPLWRFIVGDAIGTLLWVGLLVGLGWAIGHPVIHAVNAVNAHATEVTFGLLAVGVAVYAVRGRSRRRTVVRIPPPPPPILDPPPDPIPHVD